MHHIEEGCVVGSPWLFVQCCLSRYSTYIDASVYIDAILLLRLVYGLMRLLKALYFFLSNKISLYLGKDKLMF